VGRRQMINWVLIPILKKKAIIRKNMFKIGKSLFSLFKTLKAKKIVKQKNTRIYLEIVLGKKITKRKV